LLLRTEHLRKELPSPTIHPLIGKNVFGTKSSPRDRSGERSGIPAWDRKMSAEFFLMTRLTRGSYPAHSIGAANYLTLDISSRAEESMRKRVAIGRRIASMGRLTSHGGQSSERCLPEICALLYWGAKFDSIVGRNDGQNAVFLGG
jgi:hypothetical protein